MSEFLYYEFVTLDRPLTSKEMAALRKISTRAAISETRFMNEYHYGDLKVEPGELLERYFDAHLYYANWGTHELMLRIPRSRIDTTALAPYFGRGAATELRRAGEYVVLEFMSELEGDESVPEVSLATLVPLRAELISGDLRPAYLAWLMAVQAGTVPDDAPEPPLPAGLGALTAAQQAMVAFLRIDPRLVAAAATASAAGPDEGEPLRQWLLKLPAKQKDAWLLRAAAEPKLALGEELVRTFRASRKPGRSAATRTAGEIRELTRKKPAARSKRKR